jgi:hypothetical protein
MNTLFIHRVTSLTIDQRELAGSRGTIYTVDIVIAAETPMTITLFSNEPLTLPEANNVNAA